MKQAVDPAQDKRTLSLIVEADLAERISRAAADDLISVSAWLRRVASAYLDGASK